MPTKSLPANPSLENLRKQAKSLLKAAWAQDTYAMARIREFHPRHDQAITDFSLSDAQLVIARSYNFPSWPKLKQHLAIVEYSNLPDEFKKADDSQSLADRFISLACLNYTSDHTDRRDQARQLLAANPSLSAENIYTAATVGDVTAVHQMLAENPRLAKQRGGPHKWEPLLYAAYSRLNSSADGHSTLEVARLLLNHGADPNAGYLWDRNYLFTALTGVFGEGESGPVNQPEHQYCDQFARLLLEAGADPNDSQTLYNRMFTGGTRHLELLFEFGLGSGGNGVWFKRLGDFQGTPAEMLGQQMGWAAKYNQIERLKLLIQHGVDVNGLDTRLGRTPYQLALLHGNNEIADYLLQHGATRTSLNNLEAFSAAVLSGDGAKARGLLKQDPGLVDQLGFHRTDLLNLAAESDKREAVRLMVELGFDVNEVKRTAPLHLAAIAGHLEMVKLLIELGADPRLRDHEYQGTPLGWANYGRHEEVMRFLEQFEEKTE
jgi:ankyrin repeat protein